MPGVKGRSGQRPKPTAVKQLQGNPGKRKLNQREPKPRTGAPQMPPGMSEEAQKEWRWVIRNIAPGVLTKADRSMLELYCQLRVLARERIQKGRLLNMSLITQIRMIAATFGLEPSSRARLSAGDKDKEADPFEDFLNANRRN